MKAMDSSAHSRNRSHLAGFSQIVFLGLVLFSLPIDILLIIEIAESSSDLTGGVVALACAEFLFLAAQIVGNVAACCSPPQFREHRTVPFYMVVCAFVVNLAILALAGVTESYWLSSPGGAVGIFFFVLLMVRISLFTIYILADYARLREKLARSQLI